MIVFVEESLRRREIAEEILHALPEWFGIPESTRAYVEACGELPFWAALDDRGRAQGFIALKETGPAACEICVMGVTPQQQGKGVGTALWQAFRAWALERGYEYAQVKTVRQGRYDCYDRTNDFYRGLGFRELEVFPTLWDEANPCQMYVMKLE